MISLAPLMLVTHSGLFLLNPVPAAFGLRFAVAVAVFTVRFLILEYRESRC